MQRAPDSPEHNCDTALAFPCAPTDQWRFVKLSTGAIAALRGDVMRLGLTGADDILSPAIAYARPLPLPPPNRRLNITVTLQLVSVDYDPAGGGRSLDNPRLTVSDGIHTACAMLVDGLAERWIHVSRLDHLRPLDCFTVSCAAVALDPHGACELCLYINSDRCVPSYLDRPLHPIRFDRAIGEPTPTPHIHLGAPES